MANRYNRLPNLKKKDPKKLSEDEKYILKALYELEKAEEKLEDAIAREDWSEVNGLRYKIKCCKYKIYGEECS